MQVSGLDQPKKSKELTREAQHNKNGATPLPAVPKTEANITIRV